MRARFAGSISVTPVMLAVFSLAAITAAAQVQQKQGQQKEDKVFVFDDFGVRESTAIIQPKAGSPPPPRLPDGHIDLGNGKGSWSPVVIKDITGHGLGDQPVGAAGKRGPQLVEKVVEPQMLPWAQKFVEEVDATLSRDDPEARCLPPGIPRMQATPFPFQIYQLADRLIFVYEGGAHMWRIVYTDGRKHSRDATDYPTYLGEGIGQWEKDTMVIDNIGFNDKSWLDAAGHPHTEKLHVVERYTRTSMDNLHYEVTIDDPGAYSKPWTTSWNIQWVPGATPLEYICQEGNQDVQHLVGR
ncbi:MAG: hypothetical protein ABSG41_24565 [Bryobacteraceae bacterium]